MVREVIGRWSEGEGASNHWEEKEEGWKRHLVLPHTAVRQTVRLRRYYDIISPLPFALIN